MFPKPLPAWQRPGFDVEDESQIRDLAIAWVSGAAIGDWSLDRDVVFDHHFPAAWRAGLDREAQRRLRARFDETFQLAELVPIELRRHAIRELASRMAHGAVEMEESALRTALGRPQALLQRVSTAPRAGRLRGALALLLALAVVVGVLALASRVASPFADSLFAPSASPVAGRPM